MMGAPLHLPIGTILFFVCWLALAITAGVLLAYVWGRLAASYEAKWVRQQEQPKQSRSAEQS